MLDKDQVYLDALDAEAQRGGWAEGFSPLHVSGFEYRLLGPLLLSRGVWVHRYHFFIHVFAWLRTLTGLPWLFLKVSPKSMYTGQHYHSNNYLVWKHYQTGITGLVHYGMKRAAGISVHISFHYCLPQIPHPQKAQSIDSTDEQAPVWMQLNFRKSSCTSYHQFGWKRCLIKLMSWWW